MAPGRSRKKAEAVGEKEIKKAEAEIKKAEVEIKKAEAEIKRLKLVVDS
jgi:multidrug resistance efflux pump